LEVMGTVSMLNWRKHSASRTRDESLNPTSAVRAAAFLTIGEGAKFVAKAFSIVEGRL
jgi:hypothetical protein